MKIAFIIAGIMIVVVAGGLFFTQTYTKSFSPEANVDFNDGNLRIHVFYNRPSKKGREIFGKLVPYGNTWRNGANEPTTFETNSELRFGDKELKAGKYSLWTVPGPQTWQVIFNSEIPWWGVNFNAQANRDTTEDVLIVEVPAVTEHKEFEQFSISIEKVAEGAELILIWDKTLVAVPFSVK
jgi:hypothetical protein